MDFRSAGTRGRVNLSAFLLRVLKAERHDFLGENRPGAGAGQKIDSTTLVFLLRGTVNSELKILQNGSKYHYWQKDDNLRQVNQHNVYLALIYAHT